MPDRLYSHACQTSMPDQGIDVIDCDSKYELQKKAMDQNVSKAVILIRGTRPDTHFVATGVLRLD